MRPSRRRLSAACLLAAAALGSGCGGDSEAANAYVDEVTSAQRAYARSFGQVSTRLKPTSTLEQDRATLAAFGKANSSFVTELKDIDAPEEVREEHAKLIEVVVGYGRQVGLAAERLRDGDQGERARVRTDLSSSVEGTSREIADAVSAINEELQG